MAVTLTYPFSDDTLFTLSDSGIGLSGGKVVLLPSNKTGLPFNENFTDSSSFTHSSSYSVFSGDTLYQRDLRPAGATCFASFQNCVDLNWGLGITEVRTLVGGAVVSSGRLDLTGGGVTYGEFDANDNFDNVNEGCVRYKFTSNYQGYPVTGTSQVMFMVTKEHGSQVNMLYLMHVPTVGYLLLFMGDSGGNTTLHNFGGWTANSGQTYEFEVNFEFVVGYQNLFIDRIKYGGDGNKTRERNTDINIFRLGADTNATGKSDCYIEDFIVFNTMQHTTDYAQTSYELEHRYHGDAGNIPVKTYSFGVSSLQSVNAVTAIETNAPAYTINGLYFATGSGWLTSTNCYDQANALSVVNSNLDTLPVSDSLTFALLTPEQGVQAIVASLQIEYTGQVYDTSKPTIKPSTTVNVQQIETFSGTQVTTDTTNVKYTIEVDSVQYYWTADSDWLTSINSYNQTTALADIAANISSLEANKTAVRWVAYLNTDSGFIAPELSEVLMDIDFYGGDVAAPNKCIIYGYIKDPSGVAVESAEISALFTHTESFHTYGDNIIDTEQVVTYTDCAGYWEMQLVETENMIPSSSAFDFKFPTPNFNPTVTLVRKTIPNTTSILFNDL